MFKVIALAKRKAGISTEDFIEHYEKCHVPLVCEVAPPNGAYVRNFVNWNDPANVNEGAIDFDVATEMIFPDRSSFERWHDVLTSPASGGRVDADLASFVDLASFRICVVDVRGEGSDDPADGHVPPGL